MNAKELLFHRLRQLNAIDFQGTGDSDDAREAILSALCQYAVCGRIEGKVKTFGQVYEIVFGHAIDKREKTKRGKAVTA